MLAIPGSEKTWAGIVKWRERLLPLPLFHSSRLPLPFRQSTLSIPSYGEVIIPHNSPSTKSTIN